MPVISSELVQFLAANHPEDDTSTVGGAIDPAARPLDAELGANSNLEILSDGADTRTMTLRYRDAAGVIQSVGPTALNGTTPVSLGITAERVIEATLSASSGTRTVTLRVAGGGAVQHTFNPNETKAKRLFVKSVSSGAQKVYYEKTFWKNTDGVLSLLNAIMRLTADPTAKIKMGLAAAVDGSTTATNRLTAPGSVSFVDDNVDQNVPGTNLAAGSAIGCWWEFTLAADEPPIKNSFTSQLRGQSA